MESGDGICSAGPFVLDSFNWDGIGSVGHSPIGTTATPHRAGALPVKYRIRSAYTPQVYTGSITINVKTVGLAGRTPFMYNSAGSAILADSGDLGAAFTSTALGGGFQVFFTPAQPMYAQVRSPSGTITNYYAASGYIDVGIGEIGTYTVKIGADWVLHTDGLGNRIYSVPADIAVGMTNNIPGRTGEVYTTPARIQHLSLKESHAMTGVPNDTTINYTFSIVDVNTMYLNPVFEWSSYTSAGTADFASIAGDSGQVGNVALSGILCRGGPGTIRTNFLLKWPVVHLNGLTFALSGTP
ncbi:MAG: hypothetical protein H0X04_00095 [Chthoniobacterales bacterium]|nr:hypothetical protein [Chthoniobacterales bacterium]